MMPHIELVDLISQFRMAMYEHFPYISPYVYSLTPVERPGLGTMAVDKHGRMYYDPAWCETLTLEQGGYVVIHESWHLILRHCHRAPSIVGENPTPREQRLLNIAMDIVVWEMMEGIAHMCPEGGVTFDKAKEQWPKIERNMTIEQLYSILSEQEKPDCPPDSPIKGDDFGFKGDGEGEQGEDDNPNAEIGNPGGKTEVREEQESTDGDGQSKSDSDGEKTDGKGKGQGRDDGQGGDSQGEGDGEPQPGDQFDLIGGGSASDGQPREYEEAPSDTWEAYQEDRLLEGIENKIKELEEDREWQGGRGTIPAGLKRLIKERLHPAPNPWDVLRSTVARCIANHRGAPDYTYRRLNRRQQGAADMPRLKGVQKYSPKAAVVVDTSGSMTSACLAKALTVIKQGIKAIGEVPMVSCDARVNQDMVLRSVNQTFELVGGGGTDMRIPLAYVEEKYNPDVTVIVTDGYTPWPGKPMKGQLIVALTQNGDVPSWATKVRIPDHPDKEELE
jgi:predicted metal-dependent peptidase